VRSWLGLASRPLHAHVQPLTVKAPLDCWWMEMNCSSTVLYAELPPGKRLVSSSLRHLRSPNTTLHQYIYLFTAIRLIASKYDYDNMKIHHPGYHFYKKRKFDSCTVFIYHIFFNGIIIGTDEEDGSWLYGSCLELYFQTLLMYTFSRWGNAPSLPLLLIIIKLCPLHKNCMETKIVLWEVL